MDTIKTASIVALLLAVLYGVYTVLNKEAVPPPAEVAAMTEEAELLTPPDIDLGLENLDDGTLVASETAEAAEAPAIDSQSNPNIYVQVEPRDGTSSSAGSAPQMAAATLNKDSIYVQVEPRPERASQTVPDAASALAAPNDVAAEAAAPRDPYAVSSGSTPDYADAIEKIPSDISAASNPAAAAGPTPAPNQPPTSVYGQAPSTDAASDASAGASSEAGANLTAAPTGNPSAGSGGAKLAAPRFSDVQRQAEGLIADQKYREALATLSAIYGEPTLMASERETLLGMLDPLAGKVIYSTEHLLEPSYLVRNGETLQQIAQRLHVPWQLLQNINGVEKPDVLLPGTALKVVRGPFRAEVALDSAEMTVFLNELYAGRFGITIGNQPSPPPGDYAVQDKQPGRTYFAADGRSLAADHPENPYGSVWLDLGVNNVCIHGSPARDGSLQSAGCIGLSPLDARDVYGILSQGSRVSVYR